MERYYIYIYCLLKCKNVRSLSNEGKLVLVFKREIFLCFIFYV